MEKVSKILVVDDDEQMREGIVEMLTREGYTVSDVGSGAEALEKIKKEDFDVILTDLIMPGIDGMEVLRQTKKLKPAVRVIMITGFGTIENAVEAMKEGASDYVSKPFKINEVQITVKRALEESKFSKTLSASGAKGDRIQDMMSSLSNPIRRAAIEYLFLQGHSSFMGILEELGVEDHTKLSFHLRKLRTSGMVEQDEKKKYTLSADGKKVAETLKNLKGFAL
ncbi:MAG: response regulator [Candidatus Hydrothermarchaeaceae archaeon]